MACPLDIIGELFEKYIRQVYFAYGQAFFITGFAVALLTRSRSSLKIARRLWLLASFGFTHALAEWGFIFIPVQHTVVRPEIDQLSRAIHMVLIALSFYFLFAFGAELTADSYGHKAFFRAIPIILFVGWFLDFVGFRIYLGHGNSSQWFAPSDTWARYLLAFPGSALTALGLLAQTREFKTLNMPRVTQNLVRSATVFVFYAIFGGLIVPPARFFPANIVNTVNFQDLTGFPVTIFRAALGLAIAYYITRTMEVFEVENRRRIEEAEKSRLILEERERFGRDLHDGVIQSIYGAGLALEQATFLTEENPAEARRLLERVMARLNSTIEDLRAYIMGLSPAETQATTLRERLRYLIDGFRMTSSVQVKYEIDGVPPTVIPTERISELEAIVQESLANVSKHSQARSVLVLLQFLPCCLTLTIEDDGVGFNPREVYTSGGGQKRGLKNILRRVDLLGGQVSIESRPNSGTKIRLEIPYRSDQVA